MMKLIVTDLDGTLLNSKKEISFEDLKMIQHLKSQGHRITFATSRYLHTMKRYVYECDLKEDVIGSNGSFIYNYENEEIVYTNLLDQKIVHQIIDYCLKEKLQFLAHTANNLYLTKGHVRLNFYTKNNQNAKSEKELFFPIETDFKDRFFAKEVFQIGIVTEKLDEIYQQLSDLLKNEAVKVLKSGKDVVVVVPQDSSKAKAIEFLLKKYHLGLDDLIVLGDDHNDLSMFEYAKHSIAPTNAIDAIKEKSEYVTLSNDESGFSYGLKNFYNL